MVVVLQKLRDMGTPISSSPLSAYLGTTGYWINLQARYHLLMATEVAQGRASDLPSDRF